MYRLNNDEGIISLEEVDPIEALSDTNNSPIVTEEVATIIQGLLTKNARLASRMANTSQYVSSQLKSAFHTVYMEGASAQEDIMFEESQTGERPALPMPYAPEPIL